MILAHEGSVFKSGIAIAPIANFAHYRKYCFLIENLSSVNSLPYKVLAELELFSDSTNPF